MSFQIITKIKAVLQSYAKKLKAYFQKVELIKQHELFSVVATGHGIIVRNEPELSRIRNRQMHHPNRLQNKDHRSKHRQI